MVVSQRHHPFDASGVIFNGEELSVVDDTTLVGLKIDRRMRWGPMVCKLATKARQRIGALSRARHLLDRENLKTILSHVCKVDNGVQQHLLDGCSSVPPFEIGSHPTDSSTNWLL